MSFENIFGQDGLSLEKQRILGLLEREGFTEETRDAVIKWTEQMETRSLISSKEMIRFNVDRAELYEALGDIEEMFFCLESARYQVDREKDQAVEGGDWSELARIIDEKIDEMNYKYPPMPIQEQIQ